MVAESLEEVAEIQAGRGRTEEALKTYGRALEQAEKVDAGRLLVSIRIGIARTRLARSEPEEAVEVAKEAAEILSRLVEGLADEQGARAREDWAELFAVGAKAAVVAGDPAAAFHFLETGRAGALLESLEGRERIRAAVVPEALRAEEEHAQTAEAFARQRYRDALNARPATIERIRRSRAAWEAARERTGGVQESIQRTAKAASDLVYPRAASLRAVRSLLGKGEALVLYAFLESEAVALVVTGKGSRIAKLGPKAAIEEACSRIDPSGGGGTGAEAIDSLARMVVRPLELGADVRRLLVSPDGILSFVPLSLLADGRMVVYVPSATTWAHIRRDKARSGRGVLALGDPRYEKARGAPRGRKLTPLPATREEARRVGDVVLLGKWANESRLRAALAARPRWRAVHFACHGLIDTERPSRSGLALTPDGEDDGLLTALELFEVSVPADLVVLSACETAKGRVVQAEGIVGLTRAFMLAGAPRVLCSLWKVDDEATSALMVRFYELWNPKEGAGLTAAAALVKAQEHVRSQEVWKHPRHWAAWVLWGLPD
ncbi:MAG: CHAT domain-containing protein, partial [Planctomycetota bacterium]|jgi:hypothetical protein